MLHVYIKTWRKLPSDQREPANLGGNRANHIIIAQIVLRQSGRIADCARESAA